MQIGRQVFFKKKPEIDQVHDNKKDTLKM